MTGPRRATDPQEVSVPLLASEQFHAITSANPECVWLTLALTGHWRLTGEVLAAPPAPRNRAWMRTRKIQLTRSDGNARTNC
jgi:hypothetical protein